MSSITTALAQPRRATVQNPPRTRSVQPELQDPLPAPTRRKRSAPGDPPDGDGGAGGSGGGGGGDDPDAPNPNPGPIPNPNPNPGPDPNPDPDQGGDGDDPDDGDDGDDDDEDDGEDLEADGPISLNAVVTALSRAIRKPHDKPKANVPDTFDGSNPKKLKPFIASCNLYFNDNATYRRDSAKVKFALSYCRDTAFDWFEPYLLDKDDDDYVECDWMKNWKAFCAELTTNFGVADPRGDALAQFKELEMLDKSHIVRFNVKFTHLAAFLKYPDVVLKDEYESRLAPRIKDMLPYLQEPPKTYAELRQAALQIDNRYWKRQAEKSREEKKAKASENKGKNSGSSGNSGNSGSSGNKSHNSNSGNSSKSSKPANNSSSSSSSAPSHLGKDGKLTPAERQRRLDNNLCMFCAGAGHKAKDCRKPTSSAAKARAATADTSKASGSNGNSKK